MKPVQLFAVFGCLFVLFLAGCSPSSEEGAREGMPPAQETPEQYIQRLKSSSMPEDQKQAAIARFQASQEAMKRMADQAKAQAPSGTTPPGGR